MHRFLSNGMRDISGPFFLLFFREGNTMQHNLCDFEIDVGLVGSLLSSFSSAFPPASLIGSLWRYGGGVAPRSSAEPVAERKSEKEAMEMDWQGAAQDDMWQVQRLQVELIISQLI